MDIVVLVGNPRKDSRTLQLATAVADAVAGVIAGRRVLTVDLADYADRLFRADDPALDDILAAISRSDVAVLASPTYKATYTGMLKALLDRFPNRALTGVWAVPVMTASNTTHALAADVHLRPLLLELGATVATSSLVFQTDDMSELPTAVGDWIELNTGVLRGLTR